MPFKYLKRMDSHLRGNDAQVLSQFFAMTAPTPPTVLEDDTVKMPSSP